MKRLTTLLLAALFIFGAYSGVKAQSAGTIWIETSQTTFSAGDTITVTLKANSAAPIQGLTFQLRYDPACLQPGAPTSLLSGLNPLSVPQSAGLVDAIFASPNQLNANGTLAEVKFTAVAACQTTVSLENASLITADASGMAVPMQGISQGASSLAINVGGSNSAAQPTAIQPGTTPGSVPTLGLPLATPEPGQAGNQEQVDRMLRWLVLPLVLLFGLVVLLVLIIAGVLFFIRRNQASSGNQANVEKPQALYIQRGPGAGATLPLVTFPCRIGSDPDNEIRLSEMRIAPMHAQIMADQRGYAILDLGSQEGTYLNGRRLVPNQPVRLNPGDALRLGGVLLVFTPVL